jgi:hypothetical protein
MLHVFSTNRVKLVAGKQKTINTSKYMPVRYNGNQTSYIIVRYELVDLISLIQNKEIF